MSLVGLGIIAVALVAASFAEHVIYLIFTQGALYGVGGAMVYNPFIFYLDEWFIERKGLAYGIFWAGTGLCSAIIPFVMEWALSVYGFRTTLRAWAVFVVYASHLPLMAWLSFQSSGLTLIIGHHIITLDILCQASTAPPIQRRRERIEPRISSNPFILGVPDREYNRRTGILRAPDLFTQSVPELLRRASRTPAANLAPPPGFAASIGLSSVAATASVSLLNATSTIGLILIGFLTDRYNISTVLAILALTSAASVFFIWGFATTAPVLYLFSILFGIFAGGYTASWTGCITEVKKANPDTAITVVIGAMSAGRGFGCVLSGPLSEYLLSLGTSEAAGAYGTRYGSLILFTGLTALLGSFGLFGTLRMSASKPEEGGRRLSVENENEALLP